MAVSRYLATPKVSIAQFLRGLAHVLSVFLYGMTNSREHTEIYKSLSRLETTLKEGPGPLSGPQVFNWVKASNELIQYRRAWGASIRDEVSIPLVMSAQPAATSTIK